MRKNGILRNATVSTTVETAGEIIETGLVQKKLN